MKRSINFISIVLICTVFSISFIVLGIINYRSSSEAVTSNLENSIIPLLSDEIFTKLDNKFLISENVASVMSNNYFLEYWVLNNEENVDDITQYLSGISEEYGYTFTFFVSDKSKKYYHNRGILKTISKNDSWFFEFIDSGAKVDINYGYDQDRDYKLTIYVNHRVEDSKGKLIGVGGVAILIETLSNALLKKENHYNKSIYIVDKNGIVQIHSNPEYIKKMNIYEIDGLKSIATGLLDNERAKTTILSYKKNGTEYLVSSKYIKKLGMYLFIEHNKTKELSESNKNLLRTISMGIVLLVFTLILTSIILKSNNKKLELVAITDPLTGIFNRREFNRQIEIHLCKKKRQNIPLTFLLFDLDYFKKINDTYGHDIGDKVLKSFTELVLYHIRPYDLFFRIGGDEFAILMESSSNVALKTAERIQNGLKNIKIKTGDNKTIIVTLSIGLYHIEDGDTEKEIFKMADIALYNAKKEGRDCIRSASPLNTCLQECLNPS